MQLTGAEIVLRCLQDEGVEYVFGYPGGAVLNIYDELFKQDQVKHVLVRHEQGAAHAADGSKYFFTRRADLLRLWNEPQPSLLIVDRGAMPALAKSLGTFTIIAENHKKIAVMRTPGAAMERPIPGD